MFVQYYELQLIIEFRLNKIQEESTKLDQELESIEALNKEVLLLSQTLQHQ
jgi:hypothetical protein